MFVTDIGVGGIGWRETFGGRGVLFIVKKLLKLKDYEKI